MSESCAASPTGFSDNPREVPYSAGVEACRVDWLIEVRRRAHISCGGGARRRADAVMNPTRMNCQASGVVEVPDEARSRVFEDPPTTPTMQDRSRSDALDHTFVDDVPALPQPEPPFFLAYARLDELLRSAILRWHGPLLWARDGCYFATRDAVRIVAGGLCEMPLVGQVWTMPQLLDRSAVLTRDTLTLDGLRYVVEHGVLLSELSRLH